MRLSRVLPLVLVVLIGTAGPAVAHTSLVSTDPGDGATVQTAPEQVVLTFSENLREPSEASVLVDGSAVDAAVEVDGPRLVVTPGEPTEGAHEVNYRVVSADGHPVTGTTSFTVEGAAEESSAPESSATEPTATTESPESEDTADSSGTPLWLWGLLAAVVVLGLVAVAVVRARAGSRDDRS